MLCSAVAASRGADVMLIEHSGRTGKKLLLTGKGRCNVTNNCDTEEFLSNVPRNGKFLYSALSRYSPEYTVNFFEGIGVPLMTERGNRVFPVSGKASDVCLSLERYMLSTGVKVNYTSAKRIITENRAVKAVCVPGSEIECKAAVICTGGLSYPETGSTGDGYIMARETGHRITEPKASLAPIEESGNVCKALAGLSLKNIGLTIFESEKTVYKDFGEMLFTHFGISGPTVLSAGAFICRSEGKKLRAEIDLKPALDEKKLDRRIRSDFDKYKNRDFINSMNDLLPNKLIPVVADLSGIGARKKVNSVTKEQRCDLVRLLKAFPVNISGLRPISGAIITSGGVNTNDVDSITMQSKIIAGLYFAGEVLDVDAYTGGFNLQIAWSTAFAAGNSVFVKAL